MTVSIVQDGVALGLRGADGGAGNVTAIVGGVAVLFAGVPVGATLWVGASRVNSTATTATNIVALY